MHVIKSYINEHGVDQSIHLMSFYQLLSHSESPENRQLLYGFRFFRFRFQFPKSQLRQDLLSSLSSRAVTTSTDAQHCLVLSGDPGDQRTVSQKTRPTWP